MIYCYIENPFYFNKKYFLSKKLIFIYFWIYKYFIIEHDDFIYLFTDFPILNICKHNV